MPTSKKETVLKTPSSVWTRDVRFDFKPLFRALGKAVTHTATGKLEELGNDAIEAATSLGVDTPAAEVAYSLIYNSLQDALETLTVESSLHIDSAQSCAALNQALESQLSNVPISFDQNFFTAPHKQEFLIGIGHAYQQWLCDCGTAPHASESIAARFPAYFVFSLTKEWHKRSSLYKRLLELRDSPFATAERTLAGWNRYFNHLRRKTNENVFDEPFSLQQIYVPLNAFYIEQTEAHSKQLAGFLNTSKRVCVELEYELIDWIKKANKNDAIRVISGGPGSGKSSFARMFCCVLADRGIAKPVYIPLHLIDPTRDVASEVERFTREEGLLGFNPLDPERRERSILLIFDGLDELASMGKAAAQVARDFIRAVEQLVSAHIWKEHPIFVVISGRELVVQENETEFRKPKQVLTILPYLVTEDIAEYADPKGLLKNDLRERWWKQYGTLTGTDYSGLPKQLRIPEIDDITSQPLLNYLVALSFRRGKLTFSKRLNLNNVYADLVAAVHERGYDVQRQYTPIKHINLRDFVRVLEEIGLAAWHSSDGRSSSLRDILRHCDQSGLQALLKTFTEGAEAGITKLLAAFFFRRSGEHVGDEATFVFTHKSFGEYLTASRLTRGLERIAIERRRRQENADDGFDVSDALTYWARLSGPAEMTEYIQKFLRRELAQKDEMELSYLQATLADLVSHVIESGAPLERLGSLTYSTARKYETNSATSLFIALNATAIALHSPSSLRFPTKTAFGTFLRRICPQRAGPQSPLLYSALSHLDLSEQCLDMCDLYRADLSYTVWRRSEAHFANFGGANLYHANFSGANLSWSRFDGASIRQANFDNARLVNARFGNDLGERTLIIDATFRDADLRRSSFLESEISDTDFSRARLTRSSLHKARQLQAIRIEGSEVEEDDKSFIQWVLRAKKKGIADGQIRVVSREIDRQ
ncbi:pentapeptide repeat-containing protein [Rubrivivax gelatinosus]|uniref:pentapeptide repeat-containing protein n=1 Tax=Rubrivivax gelatinosus TaxID=28068 RepID=UPI001904A313|nr:pentapeptide repeat-containing protein [Rubrivivax gelatinosus]